MYICGPKMMKKIGKGNVCEDLKKGNKSGLWLRIGPVI
jgi:hypothetical protein